MILPINDQYLDEKIGFELEMNDLYLNLNITEKLYSINESENIIKRFIDWVKKIITNLINSVRSLLKNSTSSLKNKAQTVYNAANNVKEKAKHQEVQYIEFEEDMDGQYSMIGEEYMQLILDSFLLSKTNIYNQMTQYLNYFKDPDLNQYRIQNEVSQFCGNFDLNGFNFIYPKLKIDEYINTTEELKQYIKTDIDDNSDIYIISDGKMNFNDYSNLTDSMKFFEKALNVILKEADIAQKNLTTYKKVLDKLEFVSIQEIFDIFKTFSSDLITIVQSNITSCEVINKEIEFRIQSMKSLISHVKNHNITHVF